VSVSLAKPSRSTAHVNATLVLQGNDWERPARWEIVNADAAQTRSPWLRLPSLMGEVGGVAQLPIGVVLSASGQRESATPYVETLIIEVRSAIEAVTHAQPLHVFLAVQARTSFALWGRVTHPERCVADALRPRFTQLSHATLDDSTVVGQIRREAFTACDVDRIPVDHRLPSQADTRAFSAQLRLSSSSVQLRVEYATSGIYDLLLTVPAQGYFVVELLLGDKSTAHLNGTAECSGDQETIGDGTCACMSGFEPLATSNRCRRCGPGQFKAQAGDMSCELCSMGFVQPSEAGSSCTACRPGEYQSAPGAAVCSPCAPGYHMPLPGGAQCQVCEAGTVQPAQGSSACNLCPLGEFQPLSGQIACKRCDPGQDSVEGSARCTHCAEDFPPQR